MAKQSLVLLLWKVSQQKVWHNFEAAFPSQHEPPIYCITPSGSRVMILLSINLIYVK